MKLSNLRTLGLIFFSMTLSMGAMASIPQNSKLIERYFESVNFEKSMEETNRKMLEMQIQQNPSLKPYESDLSDFINKHASYKEVAPELAKFLSENFTDTEIQEMIDYNNSPVGRKANALVPDLVTRMYASVQAKMDADLPEFQKRIEAKEQALKKEKTP